MNNARIGAGSSLEEAIVRTIVYFDLFSYPLTEWEIWKWQYHGEVQSAKCKVQKFELIEVIKALEKSEALKQLLSFHDGFYFLQGRKELVDERKKRYVISDHKLKYVKKWLRFLQYAPFVREIAICNSLGYHNARESSDIDLFVVTDPGRIWTARFFLTGFLKLFRLRPVSGHSANGICPSFFVDAAALNMETFVLKPDPYLLFWTTQIMPLCGSQKLIERFGAENQWVEKELPEKPFVGKHPQAKLPAMLGGVTLQRIVEFVLYAVPGSENILRSFQKHILPDRLSRLSHEQSSGVFLSDHVLKFHEQDRRAFFREQFDERMNRMYTV